MLSDHSDHPANPTHFIKEEIETKEICDPPKVIQKLSGRAGTGIQDPSDSCSALSLIMLSFVSVSICMRKTIDLGGTRVSSIISVLLFCGLRVFLKLTV